MVVLVNVITPQGLEPLQFPTKFRSPSIMLSTFLLGIAGGSTLAAFLLRHRRRPTPRLALAWLLIGSACTGFASVLIA